MLRKNDRSGLTDTTYLSLQVVFLCLQVCSELPIVLSQWVVHKGVFLNVTIQNLPVRGSKKKIGRVVGAQFIKTIRLRLTLL